MTDRPNPFENNVVFDPREAERAIPELNDRALATLVRRFGRLEAEPHPRRYRMNMKAQLLLSPEPGYGKSHMIGRLFLALRGRATLIYLRPFQEPGSAWHSILGKVVEELDRPDDPAISVRRSVRPTQLDTFAEGVIGHLLAELIDKEIVGGEYGPDLARKLRESPRAVFGEESEDRFLRDWMREEADFLISLFVEELGAADITLKNSPSTWLSVLHAYCFGENGKGQREACMEWLKGLTGWGTEPAQHSTGREAARNAAAFSRIQDLLVLAGLCKPFVLCFDQLELLAANPELVAEFGTVVDELVTFGLNNMVVVAANTEPWSAMEKSLQPAFRDRFSEPIILREIRRPEALELARRRLQGANMDEEEITRFCETEWLDELFGNGHLLGARDFLRLCEQRVEEQAASGERKVPA